MYMNLRVTLIDPECSFLGYLFTRSSTSSLVATARAWNSVLNLKGFPSQTTAESVGDLVLCLLMFLYRSSSSAGRLHRLQLMLVSSSGGGNDLMKYSELEITFKVFASQDLKDNQTKGSTTCKYHTCKA